MVRIVASSGDGQDRVRRVPRAPTTRRCRPRTSSTARPTRCDAIVRTSLGPRREHRPAGTATRAGLRTRGVRGRAAGWDVPPHDRADRQRRHAVPRRLGDDGARTPRPRPALVVHPIVRVASRLATGGCSDSPAPDGSDAAARSSRSSTSRSTARPIRRCSTALAAAISNASSHDVRVATGDWLKMLARLRHVVDELAGAAAADRRRRTRREAPRSCSWMGDQHFTFLGVPQLRPDRDEDGEDVLRPVPGTGLGLLRTNAPGSAVARSFAELPPEIRARARERACSC